MRGLGECWDGQRAEPPRSARDVLRGVALPDLIGNDAVIPARARGAGEDGEAAAGAGPPLNRLSQGYGADRDRMTSLRRQSPQVGRWRHWIRAWGRSEPVTNRPSRSSRRIAPSGADSPA